MATCRGTRAIGTNEPSPTARSTLKRTTCPGLPGWETSTGGMSGNISSAAPGASFHRRLWGQYCPARKGTTKGGYRMSERPLLKRASKELAKEVLGIPTDPTFIRMEAAKDLATSLSIMNDGGKHWMKHDEEEEFFIEDPNGTETDEVWNPQ